MPQGYAFVGDLARGMLPMGKINREWHEKNRMPRNPTRSSESNGIPFMQSIAGADRYRKASLRS